MSLEKESRFLRRGDEDAGMLPQCICERRRARFGDTEDEQVGRFDFKVCPG
jgi:hypothetical protein